MYLDKLSAEESSGRILVAGHVDTSGGGTCNRFTASSSNNIYYVAQINNQGNYDWVNLLSQNASVQVTAISNSAAYSFASLYSLANKVFRLTKIDAATGVQVSELSGDSFIQLNGNYINSIGIRADNSNNQLYVSMILNTGVFSYSGDEFVYFKLSATFAVSWFKRVHGLSSNPSYLFLDSCVGSTNYWQLVNFYSDASTQKYGIQKISKTDGSVASEQVFPNNQPSSLLGSIKLNKNETNWYTAMYYNSNFAQSIQYGTTAANDMIKNYQTTDVFSYVDLAISQASGNFILIGLKSSCKTKIKLNSFKEIVVFEISFSSGQIVQQFKLARGSSTYSAQNVLTIQTGNTIIFASQIVNLLGISQRRVIVYKTDDSLSISTISCVNTTATSYSAYSSVATNSVTSATPLYTSTSETPTSYITLQTQLSFQNQSSPSYLFKDTDASPWCDLPLSSTNYNFEYWFQLITPSTTKGYPLPVISDCTGKTYSISSITYANGASPGGAIYVNGANICLNYGYSAQNMGDRPYLMQVSYKSGLKPIAIKVTFPPMPANIGTPQSPNHNIDLCSEQIYPLQYGFNFVHYVNSMDIDPYGNLLLTGYSTYSPFSFDNQQKGFVQLIDQRGKQYWTQAFSYSPDPVQQTQCNMATYQSGGYIYASCSIGSEYFLGTLRFLHFVKLNYLSGNVIYVKKLPNDVNPTSQEMYMLKDVSTNKILASYSAYKNGYQGFVNLVFNDTSNTMSYNKFYNYLSRTVLYYAQTFINITTDSFWIIRAEQTNGVVVMKGKLSDGSLTRALTLSDVATTGSKRTTMGVQFYSSGQRLLIPGLDTTSRILFIYLIDPSVMSVLQTTKISFPAAFTPISASVDIDESGNIYAAVGGKQIYFVKIAANTATAIYQRVWTGSGSSTFAAYVMSGKYSACNTTTQCSTSSFFTVFQTQVATTNFANQGVFIFKGSSDENCYDIRDISPSNTTWYPIITQFTLSSALTTFSDISSDFGSNTDNYPMIYDTYAQQTINSQSTETWGVTEITDIKEFKKYPLGQFYCGSIARQKSYQTNYGVGTIVDVVSSGSSTPTIVAVNASITNCQGKQLTAALWNNLHNSQQIELPMTYTYTFNNITSVNVSNTATQYNQMAFKVRYYDVSYGNQVFYYDHALLIRLVAAINISTSQANNISTCAQNPFPLGLGGEINNANSAFFAVSIVADQIDLSAYICGIGGYYTAFSDYYESDDYDSMVLRVSQSGRLVWLNNINSHSVTLEEPSGITITSDHVYVGFYCYSGGGVSWFNNYNKLIKLTKNEGKLAWAKKVVPRNIMGNYYLTFYTYYDLVVNPKNESLIMASVKYYCCSGNGQPTGNYMIYDNGVDISTLYDYQFQPFNQLTISSAGQIAFDQDTDHVYVSSTISLSSASYLDILLIKLETETGVQVWNRWLNVTISSVQNILQPIVLVNNFTKFIYVANEISTNNLQIARLQKDGTIDMHQILKTSTYYYIQFDMATDHRNGNLILVGSSSTTVQEILFLTSNLAYLRGNFRMHTGWDSGRQRLIAQADNFFYTLQKNAGFSWNYGVMQMVLGKKSLYPFEIYKHECHTYSEVTGLFSMVLNLSLSAISAPNNVIFFSNQSLFFMADFNIRVRNDQPYYNYTYLRADLMDGYRMTGTVNSVSCNSIGGGKQGPPGDVAIQLEVVKGNKAQLNFTSDMFYMQNCQGDNMTYYASIFLDEMLNSATSATNSYITMQHSTSPYYISIDATGTAPYPGVRWMTVYLSVNGNQNPVLMPLYVYPTVTPNASISEPDPICSDSDQKYPKLIGYPNSGSSTFTDSDIDQDNGNFLVCGCTDKPLMQVIDWRNGYRNSYIVLLDQIGQLKWGYSGEAFTEGSYAAGCKFSAGQQGVYELIKLDSTYALLLAKMDYVTGKIFYIRKIQGDFPSDLSTTSIKIDYQYNQAYITCSRTDISNSSFLVSGYVAKVDINPTYPIQQYYSYMHWVNSDGYTHLIYSMQVIHGLDYLVTMGRMVYGGSYYTAIVLSSKTTGKFIASTYFASINSGYYYQFYHDIVADDSYVYFAFSGYSPKSIRIVKLQIPTLSTVKSNGHSVLDGYGYSVISLANDTNYIYAFSLEPGYTNQYLTKFLKSDLSIITSVYWNERSSSQNTWQRMLIYGQYLFAFYTNGCNILFKVIFIVLPGGYQAAVINQFTLTLQSPFTCTEVIPYTPTTYYTVSTSSISGVIDFQVEVGEFKYKAWPKYYFEYWLNSSVYFTYDTKIQQNCSFQEPKFTTELSDQIIQLPLGSPQTYTFDWPVDCFSSVLTFSWSVDTYTQSNKPAFLSFTNTSTQSKLSMNPTTSDIGTYAVRVRFEIASNPFFYTERTFVVEVYPEISYGQKSFMCPTSNILAQFYVGDVTTTQWNRMDMDSQGLNFIMCGWTQSTYLNKNPTYYAGFIASYTLGLNLNFHITIQFLRNTAYCYTYYLNSTYTYSLFSYMTLQTSYADAFSLYRHTSSGQYSKGRTYTTGQQVIVFDYNLDQTSGYSYILGYQSGTKLNRGLTYDFFIFKLDKDFVYIAGNTYSCDGGYVYGRNFAITSSSIYVIFDWYNPSSYYSKAITSLSQTDGSTAWIKTPYTPSQPYYAFGYASQSYPSQHGILYYQNYLYVCFSYRYYSLNPPYDVYFARIDPTTGALMQRISWSTYSSQVDAITLLGLTSNPHYIVVSLSMYNNNYFSIFYVPPSGSINYGNQFQISYPFSKSAYALSLFERGSIIWGFSRFGSSEYYGYSYSFLYKLSAANFGWDTPCSVFQSSANYMGYLTTGIGSDYISSWQDFPTSTPFKKWTIPSKLYNRWSSNIMNTVMYPINNSSANTRANIASCRPYAAPTAPIVTSRLGAYVNSTAGGFNVMSLQSNILLPVFDQCSGDLMTYSLTFANGSALSVGTLFTFSSTVRNIMISAYQNTQAGIYSLTYTAKLSIDSSYAASVNFQIQINRNNAPTPIVDFLTPVTIYAFKNYNWTVLYGDDTEGDTPIFNVQLLNSANTSINIRESTKFESSQSFLFVNQSDDSGIMFSVMKAPNASSTQQFYIQVLVSDSFNTLTPNLYNISFTVLPNYPPHLNVVLNQTLPGIYITGSFQYTIWYQNFTDDEGDTVSVSCSIVPPSTSPDALWTLIQVNQTIAGNITFSGQTPRNNAYSGIYIISCIASDQWSGTEQYNFSLAVIAKPDIQIIGTYQNYSIRLPYNLTLLFSNSSIDPIGVQNYFFLHINNTIYNPSTQSAWLKWDNITKNITATPTMNSQGGNHSLSIMYTDYISTPQYVNFTLEIVYNWPLVALTTLANKQAIAYNWFYFDYNASELFSNPEGVPYFMYFRQSQSGNTLPYFISKNFSNGTIGGFTTDADVGSYSMECVGVDDSLLETVLSFMLSVKPCYYKCQRCWDSLYNTCTNCKANYFLLNAECLDSCLAGTYGDTIQWACLKCPGPCTLCTGSDALNNCSKCSPGYFYFKNGCYLKCPDGYYGDKQDYTCKLCHQACSICYGSSSKQCSNCTEIFGTNEIGDTAKLGYVLQGTSCIIPKCVDGQYFLWSKDLTTYIAYGRCDYCNSKCKQCTGPLENQCASCYLGAILNSSSHTCKLCEEIPGYFTNEEYQCEDICGDGILLTKQCDDGNLISGDGCSNLCMLEYGFACRVPNQTCTETIPPTFQVVSISKINQVFVQFSEPITITSPSDISPSNLQVEIDGSQTSYVFSWRMIVTQNNQMLPNRNITRFSLILEAFKQSMDGSEIIKLSFNDSSKITDLAQNQLPDGYFAQINANPYIYLSPGEQNTASSGASSMKYAFLSVFSFNLILKIVLNSSMQYLWGLVHALQVFSFLLYINIDFPENVVLFTKYFQMASGDIDEINKYIPNFADYLINQDNVIDVTDDIKLPQKFKDQDMSPYFIFAYGQKMTIWVFLFAFFLPLVLVMNKFCKKVKLWESIKGSFFFNTPLRGIVEQYIEIIMQIILNTQFIKFRNTDSLIVTVTAFVFGVCSILLPFLTMSLIYSNRKRVSKAHWKASYGMLTEECQRKSISQLYYYPIFLFQRLMIAGIIVYMQSSPLMQCGLIMLCNVVMTIYLVTVKPFEEENLQTTTVLDEIIIFICVALFSVLYLKRDMEQSQKKNMGWLVIACIMFSVCKNFGVVIYFGVIRTKQSFNNIFGAEDMQIDSLHTSDADEIIQINKNFNEDQYDFETEELIQEARSEMQVKEETIKAIFRTPNPNLVNRKQMARRYSLKIENL